MRHIITTLLFILQICSCGQIGPPPTRPAKGVFYKNNELQFAFLVFDKAKVDSFMQNHSPLVFNNPKIQQELTRLSNLKFDQNYISIQQSKIASFSKNTTGPDISDFGLATDVIKLNLKKNGGEDFVGSLNYLFFYDCLPGKFQHKWSQTSLGDFNFNTTFFSLLREKCIIIDNLIYSEISNRDEKSDPIFGESIFNEITPEEAKQVKLTITTDRSFDDVRFKTDRDNFIEFLDKTINNEWRLILIDSN